VAFSPDGKILASGSEDKLIMFWDVDTGQSLGAPLKGHQGEIWKLAFSPDGKTLASVSKKDHTIILWDVDTHQPFGPALKGQQGPVYALAFSPDGKILVSGGGGEKIVMWDIDVQSWLERARYIANRNLSKDEWLRYMGDRPYHRTCPDLPEPDLEKHEALKKKYINY
jgi:WD40 repeat protein